MPRWDVLRKVPLGNTRTDAVVPAPTGSSQAVHTVGSAGASDAAVLSVTRRPMLRRDGPRGRHDWESAKTGARLERERGGRDRGDS